MTATNLYFSTNTPNQDRPYSAAANGAGGTSGSLNQGYNVGTTEVRAADFLSLRVMVYTTGSTATGVTKRDILKFLDLARRWVLDNGPGVGDGLGQGLDYVIRAGSIATGIP